MAALEYFIYELTHIIISMIYSSFATGLVFVENNDNNCRNWNFVHQEKKIIKAYENCVISSSIEKWERKFACNSWSACWHLLAQTYIHIYVISFKVKPHLMNYVTFVAEIFHSLFVVVLKFSSLLAAICCCCSPWLLHIPLFHTLLIQRFFGKHFCSILCFIYYANLNGIMSTTCLQCPFIGNQLGPPARWFIYSSDRVLVL